MEEYIVFGLIGLALVALFLGIKKIFTKKKDLFEYEDEIILDKKMLHYGPFSGSSMYSHRKFILLLTISSSFLSAEIDLKTIDNWHIYSYNNESMMLRKDANDFDSSFYIDMSRPFCICTDPIFTTPVGKSAFNMGDKIEATMIIDNFKPANIIFNVDFITDKDVYVLKPQHHPSLRYAEIITVKFNMNSKLQNLTFNTKGMRNAMNQSEKICLSSYELEPEAMKETNRI